MTLKRNFLLGSTVLAGALAVAAPSFAQQSTQSSGEAATEVGEIVVTGSRIRRPDLTSPAPLSVVNSETIDEKGFANLADAINEQPVTGVPISPDGDQQGFGVGRSFINLFNLGSNRTLVLVNGRRFVGANVASIFSGAGAGGQVDISAIPTALVNRIETIQATGGAIYGSDAVAGVVNVITNTEYEGVEFNVEYGLSERNDAQQIRTRITAGDKFFDDKLSLSGSYEYAETDSLVYTDRDRTALQIFSALNPANTSATDGIPAQIYYYNRRIPEITQGGLAFRTAGIGLANLLTIANPNGAGRVAAQFAPDGSLVPYNSGTFYQASVASGGEGLNLAELTSLQAPVKRHNATIFGQLNITDNVRLNGEVFYNHTAASEDFNQPIYNSGLFGGISGALQMSTANPFLPAATRAAILSQPTPLPADAANPGERLFFLQRASTDLVKPNNITESDTGRIVLDLNGDFETFGRRFNWNTAVNYGQNEGFFQQDNVVQANFLQAINVNRSATGAIQCADATARAAGCQPLNLFGQGARSEAALDYIGTTFRQDYSIKQTSYEANFGGEVIELPAGWAAFNVGYEYRKEESEFQPNEASRLGIGRSAAIAPLKGEFNTSEWYAEVAVPIVGGDFTLPFVRALDFDGSYRKVDHSEAGQDESWSLGARWRVNADLTFRGSKSRSFRAPAITELFLPASSSFITATDPCDLRNIDSGPNPTARRANCEAAFVALGLPANFQLTSNIQAATQRGTTAGNPDLNNEIAEQETYGLIYQPSFVPGFTFSFDYVKIDLTAAISNFSLTSILQVCYDLPTPDQAACNRFQRGRSGFEIGGTSLAGQILGADIAPNGVGPQTGFINAGYQNFEGFTVGAQYGFDLDDLTYWTNMGRIDFNFSLFQVEKQESSATGLGFDLSNIRNTIGNSDVRWKLDTAYRNGGFAALLTTRYTGEYVRSNTATIENFAPLTLGDQYLHDLSLAYTWENGLGLGARDLTARLQIRNVLDSEPPQYVTGVGVYDLIGRYYQVGLTARF